MSNCWYCTCPSQSRLLLFLGKHSIQLQSRPHSENGSAPSGSCQHHLTPTVITRKKTCILHVELFYFEMWKEKTLQRTNHLHFDFLIQKKKKKHVGGLKTPPGCFSFCKTKHQRSTQRVVTTRRSSWRRRQKRKKKTHLVFSVFFGNCYVYFPVSCLPPPREKGLHEVLIEISSM